MKRFVDLFAVWIVGASLLALALPPSFGWVDLGWIGPMLGMIMLGMGLTLTWEDFARVGRAPRPILAGVALQFTLMPTLGYLAGHLFQLEAPFAIGLILVACCPGGTASNVITYIARADVALSVSMTTVSTLVAVLATPLLTSTLAGSRVDVDPLVLLLGTAKVVLLPVVSGVSLRALAPRLTERLLPFAPPLAVTFIVLIVGGVIASMQQTILHSGLHLIAAVGVVHALGAALGHTCARLFGFDTRVARTAAIEVGMQNGGLGIALARGGAFANPLVALPSAFSGVCSCLLGSGLAAVWSRTPTDVPDAATAPGMRT